MSATTSSILKLGTVACVLIVGSASGFGADLVLQKVSTDVGLVSYNVADLHTKAAVAYVSSGNTFSGANRMIDNEPGSVYSFAAGDRTPAVIVDLGRVINLRRISAAYSQRHVLVDFFVLQSLPGSALPEKLRLDDAALAKLTPVGSALDESAGRASVDFPEMSGRYVLIRWTPTHEDRSFDVAEISVVGKAVDNDLTIAQVSATARNSRTDGKDFGSAKDFASGKDAKEIPGEAPPAEGPPVGLPQPPPFVFVPLVQPTSP
jgi:hypothetical protein